MPVDYKGPELELKCVNTIRAVSADQPESAQSGHPGAPMGCAPMAYLLWAEIMKYSGSSPKWMNRDRFVLSNGHACALQYTMLTLAGYNLTTDDLKQFRQLGSKTPGHPESFLTEGKLNTKLYIYMHILCIYNIYILYTFGCMVGKKEGRKGAALLNPAKAFLSFDYFCICLFDCLFLPVSHSLISISLCSIGIEVCTGPLGQGICNAVGLAMAESHLAATYNTDDITVFDNHTYVLCGDGCLQEGVSGEASSLAGHLGLGKLILLYDDNEITIDGATDLSFTEDVQKRYEAYGWHVQQVDDVVTQLDDLRAAIRSAQEETDRPSIIACKTLIGYGSPSKQGTAGAHGAPLGKNDLAGAKEFYGLPKDEMFSIADDVQQVFSDAAKANEAKLDAWQATFEMYQASFPEKAQELQRRFQGKLPENLVDALPKFTIGQDKDLATRKFSEQCINAVAPLLPEWMGGSADLTPSNCTRPKNAVDYQKATPHGKYIRFGVREHAMAAICNGLFAYGGMRPYCATFLTFFGYCVGAIRLSALSKFGVMYIFTHDSIGLGEDGPTHQPIEALENLRSMPNINVFRPADSNEMAAAYKIGLESVHTPTVICCSRSTVPALLGSSVEKASQGGYVAVDTPDTPALILLSTGSEVGFCVKAAEALQKQGIATRVVSMPCQEVFLRQSQDYQASVLPGNIPTLSVEAAAVHGWHAFSHAQISMTSFGASGSGNDVFAHFGFTPDNIQAKGLALVEFYKANGPVPNLRNRPIFDNGTNGNH
jgi:transketolase